MMKAVKAAASTMLTNQIFFKPAELIEIAREAGAFPWFLDEDAPDTDTADGRKQDRAEKRSLGFQCEQFKGRTFTIGSQRINFDSIGDGHSKRYRFTKRD
jgi:hypothetical protein